MGLVACRECGRKISKRAKNCPGCGAPVKRKSSLSLIGCFAVIGLFFMGLIFMALCAGLFGDRSNLPEKQTTSTSQSGAQNSQTDILDGVDYQIIKDDTFLDYKRSVDVRVQKKISEEQLRTLALKLKAKNPNQFERTFICYYLPGMLVDSGAWATTHFNPELEVKVLGLTGEEEKKLRKMPEVKHPGSLGDWFLEDDAFPGRISIYKEDGMYYMEKMYQDGNSSKDQLVEKDFKGGRKFMKVKLSGPKNDYYVIKSNGDLQIWSLDIDDMHVLHATAEKMN